MKEKKIKDICIDDYANMASFTPTLFATLALCSHVILKDCPAVLICIVKEMVEHRERQRLEGIQKRME